MISLKGALHLFEISAPFNMCTCFQMVEHPIYVAHVYFYAKITPLAHAMSCSQSVVFFK